jgi:hypothetical protein
VIKVEQQEHDSETGDCMRAVLASVLELDLQGVPHFTRLPENIWLNIYTSFLAGCGWDHLGTCTVEGHPVELLEKDSFDGLFYAGVKSRNFEGKSHAVIIDAKGNVIHDPSPTKAHQDANVIETGELECWDRVRRRPDGPMMNWVPTMLGD